MDEHAEEALARAVDAVYAVAPADFVATRKEWVARLRTEGLREVAKEVGALRKPSVAAAAVNAVVRADDPVVARLVDVGARMRHAQATLDAAALAALRPERDDVLAAWIAAAREHAGGLTGATEAEVRDTAVAALADAGAAEVVTSGSLTRALSYSGFGEVDVADAVARTSTGVVLTRLEGGRTDEVEEAAESEEPEESEAPEEPEEAEEQGDEEARAPVDEDVSALEMELDEAEKQVAAARAARKAAAAADAVAAEALEAARARVAEAGEELRRAQQALAEAQDEADGATKARGRTAEALEAAEADLVAGRERRDAARAALEEAEDR